MRASTQAAVGAAAGVAVGAVASALAPWQLSVLAGFDAATLTFSSLLWAEIRGLDHAGTADRIRREDASAGLVGTVAVVACLAGLVAEILGLVKAEQVDGGQGAALIVLAVGAVVSGWLTVHSVYTLHYARLYFDGDRHGIEFHGDEPPDFHDFAYFALTIAMTYQVSDTDITDRRIRRAVIPHALVSFLFGTVIIGTTINVMAGLVGH